MEISKWGDAERKNNAQYGIQPFFVPGNVAPFVAPSGTLTHSLHWESGRASFKTVRGSSIKLGAPVVFERVFTSGVPTPGQETSTLVLRDCQREKPAEKRKCRLYPKFETSPDANCKRHGLLRIMLMGFVAAYCAFTAHAIDPHRELSQYLREHWGSEKGLTGGSVTAVAQTADGYLWIRNGTGADSLRRIKLSYIPAGNSNSFSHRCGPATGCRFAGRSVDSVGEHQDFALSPRQNLSLGERKPSLASLRSRSDRTAGFCFPRWLWELLLTMTKSSKSWIPLQLPQTSRPCQALTSFLHGSVGPLA